MFSARERSLPSHQDVGRCVAGRRGVRARVRSLEVKELAAEVIEHTLYPIP
jgi:hypothetical protein